MNVTFPVEDTFPLGDKPSIISEHWGIDSYTESEQERIDNGFGYPVEPEKKKTCGYAGCPDPYTMRPPCALCYE